MAERKKLTPEEEELRRALLGAAPTIDVEPISETKRKPTLADIPAQGRPKGTRKIPKRDKDATKKKQEFVKNLDQTPQKYEPAVYYRAKISKEIIQQICELVRVGNYIEVAAAFVGIQKETLFRWLRKGRAEIALREEGRTSKVNSVEMANLVALCAEFVVMLDKAKAEAEARDVVTIQKASVTDWKAAAWRLERKHGKRWGKADQLHVTTDREPLEATGQAGDELGETSINGIDPALLEDEEGRELIKQLFRRQLAIRGAGEK